MRKKFIQWLFKYSQIFYIKFKNKKPWNITVNELLQYPENSFGFELGTFLKINGFELLPKVERHDAYHLITGYGTNVEDEIALQYVCLGNGKKSPYLFGVLFLGTLIIPEFINYYLDSFRLGKKCNTFHHFDYKKLLNISLKDLRTIIFNKNQLLKIQ